MFGSLRSAASTPWWHRSYRAWQHCREASLQLIFPPACAYCQAALQHAERDTRWCDACFQEFAARPDPLCTRCGSVFPHLLTDPSQCPRCRRESVRWDRMVTLGSYRGPLQTAVIRMKHANEHGLATAVGILLADKVRRELIDHRPDLAVPMPMHWMRRIVRGINTPEILAETIAIQRSIPCAPHILTVCKRTRKQSLLPPTERRKNLHHALNIRSDCDLRGCHVLLIDDIVTTGASANEAVRNLRQAGASQITVVAVARALPPG